MHNKPPRLFKVVAEKRSRHTAGVLDAYRSHMHNKRPQTLFSAESKREGRVWEGAWNDLYCCLFYKLDLESILIEAMSRWCFIPSCCFCDLPAKFTTWQLESIFSGLPCSFSSQRFLLEQHVLSSLNPLWHISSQVLLFHDEWNYETNKHLRKEPRSQR